MWTWWERLAQDLRYGVRGFRRTPAFAATAVLSLALGIGANTAIFSIFNTLVLRPLPVRDPATLFQVVHSGDGGTVREFDLRALRSSQGPRQRRSRVSFQVDPASTMRVLVDGQADAVVGQQVTGDYFSVLGIRPVIGSVIEPRDERGSTPNRVVVLGHAYWTRRFGRDPGVLGRTMTIDEVPHTIIGVTPPEFFGLQVGRRVDVTVPIDGSDEPHFWKSRALVVRLAPGVSREAAAADLNVAFQQYLAGDKTLSERARAQAFKSLELAPSSSGLPEFRDRYGKPVQAMLAIVGRALACSDAPISRVSFSRGRPHGSGISRSAWRSAQAEPGWRARSSRKRSSSRSSAERSACSPRSGASMCWSGSCRTSVRRRTLQIRPDRNVLLFSLAATMLTGLAIGLAPALLARRVDIRTMLAAGGRSVALGGAAFKALIVVQVALSTLLVVAATLFAVTLSNLKTQSLGFVAEGVLTLTVDADGTGIEGARLGEVHRQMLQKLQALPGVQHASFATIPPLSSNEDGKPISIPGVTFSSPDDGVLQVNTVGPDFFETFGVRILKGRGITASDHQSAPQVAVVSESMARYYFPGSRSGRPAHGCGPGAHGRADRDCRRRRRCPVQRPADRAAPDRLRVRVPA